MSLLYLSSSLCPSIISLISQTWELTHGLRYIDHFGVWEREKDEMQVF